MILIINAQVKGFDKKSFIIRSESKIAVAKRFGSVGVMQTSFYLAARPNGKFKILCIFCVFRFQTLFNSSARLRTDIQHNMCVARIYVLT